jgi:hypothetical protein
LWQCTLCSCRSQVPSCPCLQTLLSRRFLNRIQFEERRHVYMSDMDDEPMRGEQTLTPRPLLYTLPYSLMTHPSGEDMRHEDHAENASPCHASARVG